MRVMTTTPPCRDLSTGGVVAPGGVAIAPRR
jgi:hypothetical protein